MMVDQNDFHALLSAYHDGELSPEDTQKAEDLLIANPSAQKYYAHLRTLSVSLQSIPDENLSPDLEQKIRSRMRQSKEREDIIMNRKRKISLNWKTGGTLASLVLVGIIAMQIHSQQGIQGRLKGAASDIGVQISTDSLDSTSPVRSLATKRDKHIKPKLKENKQTVPPKQQILNGVTTRQEMDSESSHTRLGSKYPTAKSLLARKSNQYEPYYLEADYMVESQALSLGKGLYYEEMPLPYIQPEAGEFSTEEYSRIQENAFKTVTDHPLSTLSIDVDTASYSNVRRFLNANQMPPPDAVRIEEMINYFDYDYPTPEGDAPFSVTTQGSVCPWNPLHQIISVGIQGQQLTKETMPPSNLVFLIDVSGSMNDANKLPLLKRAFNKMVGQLTANERVALVVYAGNAGLVLDSTSGMNKAAIRQAIDRLHAGGSTAGGAGIELAYRLAKDNFIEGGNNRVILATDGDFNIGTSSTGDLVRLIEAKRQENIFLTVLGFGMGNYKDGRMEQIANKGNGNYYYIDTDNEATKVLVDELGSTLFTIAKDVKIQIEFNPSQVAAYRLIGYENRILAKEDFNNDAKDAGELGAGHSVTAIYEIVPANTEESFADVDTLKYQANTIVPSTDVMTVKLRYKKPDADVSQLISKSMTTEDISSEAVSDLTFAAAVAEFGLLLRGSANKGEASYTHVIAQAQSALDEDPHGYRAEFIKLVEQAQDLDQRSEPGIFFK